MKPSVLVTLLTGFHLLQHSLFLVMLTPDIGREEKDCKWDMFQNPVDFIDDDLK